MKKLINLQQCASDKKNRLLFSYIIFLFSSLISNVVYSQTDTVFVADRFGNYFPIESIRIPNSTSGWENCLGGLCETCGQSARLYDIISDSINNVHQQEIEYYRSTYVYNNLKDSMELMYSGTVYDASLQNFFTLMSLRNVGALSDINQYLENDERATAFLLNENINPSNLMEENSQVINKICAGYVSDTLEYNSDKRLQLISIAYQLPSLGGEAVYHARAILGLDLDDTEIAFRVAHSKNANDDSFQLEPNPTSGQFTIHYTIQKEETAICTIYDAIGKFVSRNTLDPTLSNRTFDLTDKKNGIYYLNLESSTGRKMHWKVILIN